MAAFFHKNCSGQIKFSRNFRFDRTNPRSNSNRYAQMSHMLRNINFIHRTLEYMPLNQLCLATPVIPVLGQRELFVKAECFAPIDFSPTALWTSFRLGCKFLWLFYRSRAPPGHTRSANNMGYENKSADFTQIESIHFKINIARLSNR